MKVALSNLLDEMVDARSVEHADIAGFQIVCPCCREAVFKVARNSGPTSVEFFSHRRKTDQTAECERRVAGYSPEFIRAWNSTSRGQTLEIFKSVILRAIDLNTFCRKGISADGFHWRMRKLPGVSYMKDRAHYDIGLYTDKSYYNEFCKLIVDSQSIENKDLLTGYSFSIQKEITLNILNHFSTKQGKAGLDRLIENGLGCVFRMFSAEYNNQIDEVTFNCMRDAIKVIKASSVKKMLSEGALIDTKIPIDGKDITYGDELMFHTYGASVAILLGLPYKEMIENHKSGKDILAGIDEREIFGFTPRREVLGDEDPNREYEEFPYSP